MLAVIYSNVKIALARGEVNATRRRDSAAAGQLVTSIARRSKCCRFGDQTTGCGYETGTSARARPDTRGHVIDALEPDQGDRMRIRGASWQTVPAATATGTRTCRSPRAAP